MLLASAAKASRRQIGRNGAGVLALHWKVISFLAKPGSDIMTSVVSL